jgi:hypothetical protein
MGNKVLVSFLVVAIFNLLVGCYSSELVTPLEYNKIKEEDKPDDIRVITKDFEEYHFSDSNYYIENDTLYGKVSVKELSFEGKCALNEIESIQVEYFSQKYHSLVTVLQYQKMEAERGKPDEIYLTKTDFTKYHFMKPDYHIENDTLYGKGKLILDREELLNKKIALSNIESIVDESINLQNTVVLSGGLLLTLAVIFVVVAIVVFVNWEL